MAIRVQRAFLRAPMLVALAAVLLVPAPASGQELPQPVVFLQLNFSDPGARSMWFGGAFVALADDATAAFANPAGLVQLVRPEVSIEGRRTSYSTPFTEGGRAEGAPSGFGLDTTAGLRTAKSEETVSGLSFLSLAYPKGRWSVAFSRHQLADYRFFGENQGLFGGGTDCCQLRYFDQRMSNDFDLVNYSVSGAYRVGEALSLGLAVAYLDASVTAITDAYLVDDDSLESIFGPNSYLPDRLLFGSSSLVDDHAWTLTGGFLWSVSERWRIGGVYRQAPEVETAVELTVGRAIDFGVPPGEVIFRRSGEVELPAVFGLGCAYRAPGDRLTVSFQWDRVQYSSIERSLELDDQKIDDADELHLGGEYVIPRSKALVALRAGAWLDPDHQLRATTDDPFVRALLRPGDDELHLTAGLGVAFKSVQIDLGVDLSDAVDTVSISAIYGF